MDRICTEIAELIMFIAKLLGFGKKDTVPSTDNTLTIALEPENLPVVESNREKLYNAAKSYIGQDLTPEDRIPDDVACVAQFQEVFKRTFGTYIGTGSALYSTYYLAKALAVSNLVEKVSPEDAQFGDIWCFATGENERATSPNVRGHVFIMGKQDWMSNDSTTGQWKAHWRGDAVKRYFIQSNGFPAHVYRVK